MRNGRTDAFLGIKGRKAIENRTYSITPKRMISGLVLKDLNGECFVICGFYKYTLLASTEFNLTVPSSGTIETRKVMGQLQRDNLAAFFAGKPLLTAVN